MKKIIAIMLLLTVIPSILAVPIGQTKLVGNVPIVVTNPNVAPMIFLNIHSRVLTNDPYGVWQNGNIQNRPNNYAFVGEGIQWKALVWDINGIEDVQSVNGILKDSSNITTSPVSCSRDSSQPADGTNLSSLGYSGIRQNGATQDETSFSASTMQVYTCLYTVTPSVHGSNFYTIQVQDNSNSIGNAVSQEFWFLNPAMDISISGSADFGNVQPGQVASSPTMTITNNGEGGMNVQYRISGSDFYDTTSSGAKCSDGTNKLSLTQFKYSATQGNSAVYDRTIPYGKEVTASTPVISGSTTSPGASTAITFKLSMPTPCRGTFNSGEIDLWAIAI